MIGKIIVAILLLVLYITVMYESIDAIRKKDLSWAVICSIGSSLIGLLLGVVLGALML